jgi:alkylation response protein AidB-like acyl-CoA dehydrogenase
MNSSETMQTQATAGASAGAKLLESARALVPSIRAAADTIEQTRELPKPIFEAIADAGLFIMALPRAIGGHEVDFPSFVQIIETIASGDASAAWCVSQGAVFGGTYSVRMPIEAARSIWMDVPRAVVANTPAPTGKAIVVPGGYRVTGKHPFSSGAPHAAWFAAQGQVIENGQVRQVDGKPEIRYFFVPRAEAEVLDTWKTRGMRGTGTHHFAVDDVFVPAERSVPYANAPLRHDGPFYKIARSLHFASGDAATSIAIARNALEAFYELAGSKAPRYQTNLLRDLPMTQAMVGRAEATLRCARAYLMQAVQQIWGDALAGEVTMESRTNLRIASTHAIHLAAQVVHDVYIASGATAVFEGNYIQRLFQDVNVITQHVQSRLSHYDTVGKYVLGVPFEEQHL